MSAFAQAVVIVGFMVALSFSQRHERRRLAAALLLLFFLLQSAYRNLLIEQAPLPALAWSALLAPALAAGAFLHSKVLGWEARRQRRRRDDKR